MLDISLNELDWIKLPVDYWMISMNFLELMHMSEKEESLIITIWKVLVILMKPRREEKAVYFSPPHPASSTVELQLQDSLTFG